MITTDKLERLILDQKKSFRDNKAGSKRSVDFNKYLRASNICIISGVRRCGKSTLLRQFSNFFKIYHYLNFDDERLVDFTVEDFDLLLTLFHKTSKSKTLFFDEIQNIEYWERFIRRAHDQGYKIFITGSNARLLSSELGTYLTGRYYLIELYPFSFREYLVHRGVNEVWGATTERASLMAEFDTYFNMGGFPEFLKDKDKEYLIRIFSDILQRDIASRYNIRNTKELRQLAHHLFSHFTNDSSYNSLAAAVGVKSANTIKDYIDHMESAYLVFELFKYDYSLKKQHINQKKVYVIDNAMRDSISFSFSGDRGKYLENLVYLEIRRSEKNIFFHRNKSECDFIVTQKGRVNSAIQVCYELSSVNIKRELKGLREAMELFNLPHGQVVTYAQSNSDVKLDTPDITVKPAWQWLLERP